MLPADDQRPVGGSGPVRPAGYLSRQEILQQRARPVKEQIDKVVNVFFVKRPAPRAAKALAEQLSDFFELIEGEQMPKAREGERVYLERLRNAVREAAIAVSMLADGEIPSIELLSKIDEKLRLLQGELAVILEP